VVLIGMMGAGKSTVGMLLAEELGWTLIDLDHEIEATSGSTIAEIFATEGESVFRAREVDVLEAALCSEHDVIVASGGGIVTSPGARELLQRHDDVVLLAIDPTVAADRIGDNRNRPLLGDDPEKALRALAEQRGPLYATVADVVISVDHQQPAETAAAVMAALELGS
jgi:shikimate kinase